ncbi:MULTISPECIES: acyl-CoA carboxylase subunit epsilon [Arthrobacter]|uniref:acyl-CoA carboxylase subunit epsilon n=1 Tax=Arthrobacter TaxID=1663 RepID=UPI001D14BADC|nr:acyl-CoA carboxylase subunit epsilon [Arthrobacter caoxuetaonis]MCC9194085.1 acyl-CoA carboxylase subunit epsilon [Arthrobacter sp. zg-Y916]
MSIVGEPDFEPAVQPLLQVLTGSPTDEELAALTAVVLGLGAGAPDSAAPVLRDPATTRRAWTRRRQLSLTPAPGPGSWRRTYR